VRAARRAARAGLEQQVERRRVAVERRVRTGPQAAAADVVPARVQREDVPIEAHEHVRRRREHVRLAEAVPEGVVRSLRLEDAHRGSLSQLRQVTAQLQPRGHGRRRARRNGEHREQDDGREH
jgi:hypothetical protein